MMPVPEIDIRDCERVVEKVFTPFAQLVKIPLEKTGEGCFEMRAETFTMRLRCGLGPWTDRGHSDLDVTIVPTDQAVPFCRDELANGEVGIVAIARYCGGSCEVEPIWTLADFEKRAEQYHELARRYGVKFLLGDENELFQSICSEIEEKSAEAKEAATKMRFIPGVQKRWHLPPPPNDK